MGKVDDELDVAEDGFAGFDGDEIEIADVGRSGADRGLLRV
jgi:hypothetical protein